MGDSISFRKKKSLFFIVFFVAFSAFTADVVDLREELNILPGLAASLDSNVTTGIISHFVLRPDPIRILHSLQGNSSAKTSFLYLFSCGFRAPPHACTLNALCSGA